jgi:hypothetical protein
MKEPKPRTKFASEADEREHIIDCLCWLHAPYYHGAPGTPREIVADALKLCVKQGKLVIDLHPDGKHLRLIPSVHNPARGAA